MSTTTSNPDKNKTQDKASASESAQNFYARIKRQPNSVLLSLGMIVLSFVSLIFNIILMIRVVNGINMQNVAPAEGQLLNRPAIENASTLLEQTVEFREDQ